MIRSQDPNRGRAHVEDERRKARAVAVVQKLQQRGHQAYLVGGCVRDLMLGREPDDYDIATDATPGAVMEMFPEALSVGAHFGVVLVVDGPREERTETAVATFRNDGAYSDGRRPEQVSFTRDPREDVLRRDFTINGLLWDPVADQRLDYVGGEADLRGGLIRAIGEPERRFREDRLRLLRAIRFAARLGFRIEDETWRAILEHHRAIQQVSAERIRDELLRILTEGGARRGFELLDSSGLLADLLPEIAAMKGVAQPPEYHPEGDVWTHTLMLLEKLETPSPALALAALLHDVGKPPTFRVAERIRFDGHASIGAQMAGAICRRLRLSRDVTDQVVALVAGHMRFMDVTRMRASTLKRFMRTPKFDEHLELHRIDCLSSHGSLDTHAFLSQKAAEIPPAELRPAPLVTGDDLIEQGYQPGARFREILGAVEEAQLEGELQDREAALEYVRSRFPL